MTIQEIIDAINEATHPSLWGAEDHLHQLTSGLAENVSNGLNTDKHRWYEITTSVYRINNNFIGIEGASQCYSEEMSFTDCCVDAEAFEMEEVKTVTYKRK